MVTIQSVLDELTLTAGVDAALVIGRDGFVIESRKHARSTVNDDAIAAAISSGIGSSEVIGRELAVGHLDQGMFEYQDGMLLVLLLGVDAILAVVAPSTCNLGNVRYQVKKRVGALMAVL